MSSFLPKLASHRRERAIVMVGWDRCGKGHKESIARWHQCPDIRPNSQRTGAVSMGAGKEQNLKLEDARRCLRDARP